MKVKRIKIYSRGEKIEFSDFVVSRTGRVFRWTDGKGTWKGREMSVRYGGNHRYPRVSLGNGEMGKAYNLRLHQVVAHTFLGKPPDGYEIIHKDEDKQNCRLSNLKYGTRSENLSRSYKKGGRIAPFKGSTGGSEAYSILNYDKVKEIFILYYELGFSIEEVACKFWVSESLVEKVLRGYNWNYDKLPLEELKKKYLGE